MLDSQPKAPEGSEWRASGKQVRQHPWANASVVGAIKGH